MHPSCGRRSLVWQADGVAPLAGVDRAAVGTIALPQRLAAERAGLVAEARRERGMGLLLDGEAWRAQLEPGHPLRTAPGFEELDWVDGAAHVPEDWSPRECDDFAAAYVEQQAAHATLLTTPAHDAAEPLGALRRTELEIAAACADHVRGCALREPAADDPHRVRRDLYAGLRVRADQLDDHVRGWLTGAYASIDVDGYLLGAADFTASEPETARLLALALALQEATGRPVLLAGVGDLWQAALVRGVAATVVGERSRLAGAEPGQAGGDLAGDATPIYHGAILGTAAGEVARRRLFMRHACDCGAHPEGAAPEGAAAIAVHDQWWTMREARQLCGASPDRASLLLSLRVAAAAQHRERLDLPPLRRGWLSAASALGAEQSVES